MPTYTFKNKITNEETDRFISYNEYDKFVEENSDLERVFKPVRIVAGTGFNIKTDNGFRDVLKRIKGGSGMDNTIDSGNLGEI